MKTIFKRFSALIIVAAILISAQNFGTEAYPFSRITRNRVASHDPSIIKAGNYYYVFGSHLEVARSTNLFSWTSRGGRPTTSSTIIPNIRTVFADDAAWSAQGGTQGGSSYQVDGNLWAPDVIWNPNMNKFCMYMSVNGDNWASSIVLLTADNIEGPYTRVAPIVYSGFRNVATNNVNQTDVPRVLGNNPNISRYLRSNGQWNPQYGTNAIDPNVFFDETGKLWMVYGSWFGGLYMLELDEQTGLRDYNVTYPTTANVSDAYMGKKVAGGFETSGEGPYIKYMTAPGASKGYYYLFISYGHFHSEGGYNMRVFRSDNPDGPYVDQNGNSAIYTQWRNNIAGTTGFRLMSNYKWDFATRPYTAQGHNSVFTEDGKNFVIYHTKFGNQSGAHEVRVHQMFINRDGWPVAAPYEYAGEFINPQGHSSAAIVGEYDFIFHTPTQNFIDTHAPGPGQFADFETPVRISLNANGTVSGSRTGTWTVEAGTPYMSLTLGGVTYRGNFVIMPDESNNQDVKLCFTAAGNNTAVWGSKVAVYDAGVDSTHAVMRTDGFYTFKNQHSNRYLEADGNIPSAGMNVRQGGTTNTFSPNMLWELRDAGNGYYYIHSLLGEREYVLDVPFGEPENGTNIHLWGYLGLEPQHFKFMEVSSNTYTIRTRPTGDLSCVEVFEFSTVAGANIVQWEANSGAWQNWIAEFHAWSDLPTTTTPSVTSTPPITTTTPPTTTTTMTTSPTVTTTVPQTTTTAGITTTATVSSTTVTQTTSTPATTTTAPQTTITTSATTLQTTNTTTITTPQTTNTIAITTPYTTSATTTVITTPQTTTTAAITTTTSHTTTTFATTTPSNTTTANTTIVSDTTTFNSGTVTSENTTTSGSAVSTTENTTASDSAITSDNTTISDGTTTSDNTTVSDSTTTVPEITTEPITTTTTTEPLPDCDCDKADCEVCSEDGKWYALGNVDGKDGVTIFDALEILKHLVKMNSAVEESEGGRYAAKITLQSRENDEVTIFDALEILKHLVNMTSRIDGVHINGVKNQS